MPSSTDSSPDLRNQVALVTGASRGLGRAFAQALAQAGAKVAVLARTPEPLEETAQMIRQHGGTAEAISCDVTVEQEVMRAVAFTEEQFGPVDLLINNAGVVTPLGPLWEVDAQEWWRSMEVNLRSALLCTRTVLPGMVERQQGCIINIASGAGTVGFANGSAYVVSKTALIRFTECVALDCAEKGVSVFSVHPGTVRTDMSEYLATSPEGRKHATWFGERYEEILVPIERAVNLIMQLASGQADVLSGRYLSINDNLEQLTSKLEELQSGSFYTLRVQTID